MDPERELCSAGTDPRYDPNLVNAGMQPWNVKLRSGPNLSTSSPHSRTLSLSGPGNHYHCHPHNIRCHDNGSYLPHPHSEPSIMSDTSTRSTLSSGPSSLSEARASGLGPTRTPPIGSTKSSHRTPYQHLPSHPDLVSLNLQRSSSDDQLRKLGGGGPPFSPPFLHPASLRTKPLRAHSPFSASAQRSKGGKKPRPRFSANVSPPNSPAEPEPEYGHHPPKPFISPFTIRGFLSLSTFSKVIGVSFACCVFLLLRALLGIGHSAESCGVYAHQVTEPDLRSGFPSESYTPGLDVSDLKLPTDEDQRDEDERGRVWLEMVDEIYGYQYDRKLEEYGIEHEEDGGDRYDDEYEHEDFLDHA